MNNQILVQPKIQGDKIILEIPKKILEGILWYKKIEQPQVKKRTNWTVIESLYGIWKNKDIDPMEYERDIRAEWDRKLDI